MKRFRSAFSLFAACLMALAVPASVLASHCQANSGACYPSRPDCTATIGNQTGSGTAICCADLNGDLVYHYVTVVWEERTCTQSCPVYNNGVIVTYTGANFPVTRHLSVTPSDPPADCSVTSYNQYSSY